SSHDTFDCAATRWIERDGAAKSPLGGALDAASLDGRKHKRATASESDDEDMLLIDVLSCREHVESSIGIVGEPGRCRGDTGLLSHDAPRREHIEDQRDKAPRQQRLSPDVLDRVQQIAASRKQDNGGKGPLAVGAPEITIQDKRQWIERYLHAF